MKGTNRAAAKEEGELEKKLRSRSGIQAQMLAKAQRERLQVGDANRRRLTLLSCILKGCFSSRFYV